MTKEFTTKSNKPVFFYAGWLFTFILISGASAEDWTQKADYADSETLLFGSHR